MKTRIRLPVSAMVALASTLVLASLPAHANMPPVAPPISDIREMCAVHAAQTLLYVLLEQRQGAEEHVVLKTIREAAIKAKVPHVTLLALVRAVYDKKVLDVHPAVQAEVDTCVVFTLKKGAKQL